MRLGLLEHHKAQPGTPPHPVSHRAVDLEAPQLGHSRGGP